MKSEAKLVTTQAALDKALADGAVDLIVAAPNGAWLEVRHDGLVRLWGSSRVEAWGSSHVVARDSSHVEAWESSHVVARDSSHVDAWESSRVDARDSSRVEAWGSSHVVAGRWTAVHLWSQRVTLTGEGHIIDMTAIDLTDVGTWRDYTGADRAINPERDHLILGHVSSEDHPGRLGRDGQISIGCWSGTVADLRVLAASDRWPSGANEGRRDQFRPRLLAFADLCDAQIEAWDALMDPKQCGGVVDVHSEGVDI